MQRLTRIKQLAHTYLVYPGATHTRFEHSLGTLFIADRMCRRFSIDGLKREVIRAASLLHDVGHGPYSHTFENPLSTWNKDKVNQEAITKLFLEHDEELIVPLNGAFTSPKYPYGRVQVDDIYAEVLDVFTEEPENVLARSIVSGTIDADKFDYLLRDSFYTGTTYGIFDRERVLSTLRVVKDPTGEYPALLMKGTQALESFRLARYLLYSQVYQHKTRVIADAMFVRAVEMAKNLFHPRKLQVSKGSKFVEEYKKLDDASVVHTILGGGERKPKSLIQRIRNRKLLKLAVQFKVTDMNQGAFMGLFRNSLRKTKEIEEALARKCNIGEELVFAIQQSDESALKMYHDFGRVAESGDVPLLYLDENGRPQPYEDVSPISVKKEATQLLSIYCPSQCTDEVEDSAKKLLGTGT